MEHPHQQAPGQEPADELPTDDVEGINAALQLRGDEYTVSVEEPSEGGKYAQIHVFEDPSEFSLQAIKELFGGGRYKVRFRHRSGRTLRGPVAVIPGKRLPRPWEAEETRLEEARTASQADLMERILERLERLENGRGGGGGGAGGLDASLLQIMAQFSSAQAQASATMMAPLLKALADRDRPEPMDVGSVLEGVARLMEVAGDRGGGGGSYLDLVKPVLARMDAIMQGGGAGAATHEQLGAPAPVPPGAPAWYQVLGARIPELVHLARTGFVDPESLAARVAQDATDNERAWFSDVLTRESFDAEFYQWVPDAVAHRSWFDTFFGALDALLNDDQEDPDGDDRGRRDPAT